MHWGCEDRVWVTKASRFGFSQGPQAPREGGRERRRKRKKNRKRKGRGKRRRKRWRHAVLGAD
jgi:hypothetical protein